MPEFASEGFDLDDLRAAAEDVVLEIGGKVVSEEKETKEEPLSEVENSPMKRAEAFKAEGNAHFKNREWREAYDLYTQAIDAAPGMKGDEMLKLQKEWQDEQNRMLRDEALARDQKKINEKDMPEQGKPEQFQPPRHDHGEKLAVYYSNRAASSLQLADPPTAPPATRSAFDDDDAPTVDPRLTAAAKDCSIALLYNPVYTKAWMRRSTIYERMGDTESALRDANESAKLDPHNSVTRMAVARLQKLEDARVEKLKEETLGKLKDLGNSILGNFGLSMDNFQAQKDPTTGSYSISFNQGGGGGGGKSADA